MTKSDTLNTFLFLKSGLVSPLISQVAFVGMVELEISTVKVFEDEILPLSGVIVITGRLAGLLQ